MMIMLPKPCGHFEQFVKSVNHKPRLKYLGSAPDSAGSKSNAFCRSFWCLVIVQKTQQSLGPRNPRLKDAHTGTKCRLEQCATHPPFLDNLQRAWATLSSFWCNLVIVQVKFKKVSDHAEIVELHLNNNIRKAWATLSSFWCHLVVVQKTRQSLGPRYVVWNFAEFSER